jgi:hypothetical protein
VLSAYPEIIGIQIALGLAASLIVITPASMAFHEAKGVPATARGMTVVP